MSTTQPRPLTTALLYEIAGKAECDPRTVAKVLRHEPVRPLARDRIVRVLLAMGLVQEPELNTKKSKAGK